MIGAEQTGKGGNFAAAGQAQAEAVEERQIAYQQRQTAGTIWHRGQPEDRKNAAVQQRAEWTVRVGERTKPGAVEVHHVVGREVGEKTVAGERHEITENNKCRPNRATPIARAMAAFRNVHLPGRCQRRAGALHRRVSEIQVTITKTLPRTCDESN